MSVEYHEQVITTSIVADAMDPTKSTLFKLKTLITDISKVGSRLDVRRTTASCTTSNILVYITIAQTLTEIPIFT